jgi:hypothetical protein
VDEGTQVTVIIYNRVRMAQRWELKLDDLGWAHTVSTGTFMSSIGLYYDEVAAATK